MYEKDVQIYQIVQKSESYFMDMAEVDVRKRSFLNIET